MLCFLGSALLLTVGCQDTVPTEREEPAPPVVRAPVRDSAGVQIVENEVGIWTAERQWRLSPEPDLRIGTVDGDSVYMFERIVGAIALSDGRIVVADEGANTLRIYDASGRWTEDVGGPGEGPGEFASIRFVSRFAGDSILAFDWSNQRYTVFSPNLDVARVVSVDVGYPGVAQPHLKAVTESGAPILIGARPPWVDDPVPFYGQPGHLLAEESPGSFDRRVHTFTGKGNFWQTLYEAAGEQVAVISTGAFHIDLYDLDGTQTRSIRRETPPSPIPAAFFEADPDEPIATLVGPEGRSLSVKRGARDRDDYPPHLPFTDDIDVDRAGNFWVRHYRYRDPVHPMYNERQIPRFEGIEAEMPVTYSVFDPGGQLLGEIHMPPRTALLDVGDDWLLCLVKDDLDVEYIERYRIEKPPGD